MQAKYGENEIESLLKKVRIFNKEIGSYQIHAITENFDYVVKLSNGRISLNIEDLQDDDNDDLTPERLEAIANRFVPSDKEAASNAEQQSDKASSQESVSVRKAKPKNKRSTIRILFIILILLFIILGGKFLLDNINYRGKTDSEGKYKEKVMTVEEIERSQPSEFLSVGGTYRETFLGDKFKVYCEFSNTATIVTYKDAVLRFTYYSKTNSIIGTKDYTVYESFPPGTNKSVELKIDNYKNVNSIGWELIRAEAY